MNFTLGTAQLGLDYGIANFSGKPDKNSAFEILNQSVKSGVRYYDTAAAYGNSEEILGEYFAAHNADVFIITKIPPVNESLKNPDDEIEIIDFVLNSVNNSKKNLRRDYLDCLMFHRVEDYFLNEKLILSYLCEHADDLKINSFGISLYDLNHSEELLNDDMLSAYQIPANLLDHRFLNSGFIQKASELKNQIFIRSLYLQGLFFVDENNIPENIKEFSNYKRQLFNIIEKSGLSFSQFTVNFFKTFYSNCNLIFGCESVRQLIDNVNLLNNSESLDEKYFSEVIDLSRNIPVEIINPSLWVK